MWSIFPRIRKLRFGIMTRVNAHFDEMIDARIAKRQAGEYQVITTYTRAHARTRARV